MNKIFAAVGLAALLAGAPVIAFADDAPTTPPTPAASAMPMKAKIKHRSHHKKPKMAPTPMATPMATPSDAPKS